MKILPKTLGRVLPKKLMGRNTQKSTSYPIPNQLKNMDFVPVIPGEKGRWKISPAEMTKEQIQIADQVGAWSKNGRYLSWMNYHKLPVEIQSKINKKYNEFSIKTGKQSNTSAYIVVIDLDNDNGKARENLDMFLQEMGTTFIRQTPSGGYHIYYQIPSGTNNFLPDRKRVDFRTRGLDIEILNGALTKEIDSQRSTFMDDQIRIFGIDVFEPKLIEVLQKLGLGEPKLAKPRANRGSFTECENPVEMTWELMEKVLNKYYLPAYCSKECDGKRDTDILFATMGFLRQNYSLGICEQVLTWINEVAEYEKDGSADERHYDFETEDNFGEGTLMKYGFDDFVYHLTVLPTFQKHEAINKGRNKFADLEDFELLKKLDKANNMVMLHNGPNIMLAQLSHISTTIGQPISVFLVGEPSEGKSEIERLSMKPLKEYHFEKNNVMTFAGLYRSVNTYGNEFLNNRIVVFGDQGRDKTMERNEEVRDVIKALASEGYSSYTYTDEKTGESKKQELTGNTSMMLSSPRPPKDEQELSRGWIIHAARVTGEDILNRIALNGSNMPKSQKRMQVINRFYEDLSDYMEYVIDMDTIVYNPYQHATFQIALKLKYEKRQLASVMSLIDIVTRINHRHRSVEDGILISDRNDVMFVYNLLRQAGMFKHEMPLKFRPIHMFLEEKKNGWFNRHEIFNGIDFKGDEETLRRYLTDMKAQGFVNTEYETDMVENAENMMYYNYKKLDNEVDEFVVELTEMDIKNWNWHFGEEEDDFEI